MGRRSKLSLPKVAQLIDEAKEEVVVPEKPERATAFRGEEDPEPVLVNLTGLDRSGLERVATREFGVQIDSDLSDDDVLHQVRHLVEGRNKFGLR